ncbi:PolC-type DNA polymerase III [Alkalibacterium thalassium]|uniref:DNA polymerase III PolC-type n=1 Tax=Alkalibacterium thalassium TaxID=426701 RepID=A0A1G8VVP4_9LACT|nr:PolC-type DNA polymerase III [Alkalibacterium thalassium]SDJ69847.1 DNA polymerase-3 subunit alpha [Alkalibacterium thalassium]
MSLNKTELFQTLLKQTKVELSDEDKEWIHKGEVESVTVYKREKKWDLVLTFPNILPYRLYLAISHAIRESFKAICDVNLTVRTSEPTITVEKVRDYWNEACKQSGVDSPICNQVFSERFPVFKDKKWLFIIDQELVFDKYDKEFLPQISKAYHKLGFPETFSVRALVDAQASQDKVNEFKLKKEENDRLMAQEYTKMIETAEKKKEQSREDSHSGPIKLGRAIPANEEVKQMIEVVEEERRITLEGYVFDSEVRELRSGRKLLLMKITDYSSSFTCKRFSNNESDEALFDAIKPGIWVKVRGSIQEDTFMRDLVMNVQDITQTFHAEREDTFEGESKRIELHAHTNMSQMDAISGATALIEQAAKWGHEAIAITDHGGGQSFPEAHAAGQKNNIKVIYGLEANLVDDGVPVAYNESHLNLNESTYVVFDVETTGLSAIYDSIIELAAVKMHKGNVVEEFQEFIDPGHPLSETTVQLTGITDDMVRGSKTEKDVLERFRAFSEDAILVAHNASFDMGFLNTAYKKHKMDVSTLPVIDTLEFSRFINPTFKSHRLNTLAKRFKVNLEQHHRAIYDSQTTGNLLWIFVKKAQEEHNIHYHDELNQFMGEGDAYKRSRPSHVTLWASSQSGLKNLFKLISTSLVDYFYRVPRLPRSVLEKHREGIIVGSGCSKGEVFEAMMQKGYEEARRVAEFYDYLEIMPKEVYSDLIQRELVRSDADLEDILTNMIKLGEELDKPVIATGNVHYIHPEDAVYRDILMETQSSVASSPGNNPAVHFRTTNEMMDAFRFLGEDKAREVVIENPQLLNRQIEDGITPVKKDLFTPKMEGAEEEIRQMSYDKAHSLYGDPLPEIIGARLEKELDSIIGNGFSVIYLISQKLVHKSIEDGYLVGSRGSVGSSFVATMTGITEVNPMPPHYRCNSCQYSEFFTEGEVGSGFDLPEKACPNCQADLYRDGQDIPFETFLGFKGDKVPDIDLNFSGEYQATAHHYTKELFGEEYVYRAGTIGTIADRTAFGFVKGFERDHQLHYRSAEIDRLSKGLTGVKRTTGQHPGGIIVIPDYMDVYDFSPVQYPADDQESKWKTTHFDFHSIHDNVLKLDILGHDDPTMIRKLQDLSGIDPLDIPVNDPDVMKLFSGTEVLGVTEEQIFSKTGTLGVPEFGTRFVRQMLEQTNPTTFAELLQISGLSHGTDVWLGNAEELIRLHNIPLAEVIGCRDDIMVYLQHQGLEDDIAFKIMEHVRKGRGIPDEWQAVMREKDVPEWYIDSCLKIKYMFPKAHAAAYVLMALRVAYFKVHYPLYYYAAYFSIRASDFDLEAMCQGKDGIKSRMKEITDKGMDASTKEKNLLTVLELANEMVERGFEFKMVDLDKSHATDFIIEDNALIAPFRAVPSLGASVAGAIVEAREDEPFLSKEDLSRRGKVSKTVMEYLETNHALKGLPDENQLSLFDI